MTIRNWTVSEHPVTPRRSPMRWRPHALAALALVFAALVTAPSASADAGPAQACTGSHWVGSWQAAPGHDLHPGHAVQTLRMVVAPHRGGDRLDLASELAAASAVWRLTSS